MVAGPYKGCIYSMRTAYNDSLSLFSVTEGEPVRLAMEEVVCSHVHALNEKLHKKLEE